MATAQKALLPPPPSPPRRDPYLFTVDDYHTLIEAGNFKRDDRIELINGELTVMPPIGPEHSSHTRSLTNLLPPLLPKSVMLQMNEPITIPKHSEPQPDAAIVKARPDNYRSAHPHPKDVLLIIEVSDSSIQFDKDVKARLYGKHGIPEYWVVDIPEHCVHVFTDPTQHGYRSIRKTFRGEKLKSAAVPGLAVKTNDLLL